MSPVADPLVVDVVASELELIDVAGSPLVVALLDCVLASDELSSAGAPSPLHAATTSNAIHDFTRDRAYHPLHDRLRAF